MGFHNSSLISFIGLIISIFIFLNGFLMNRSEIHETGVCSNISVYCKYSPYKRVVLLLIDALKYEFLDPTLNPTNYYHGHVDVINSLYKSNKDKYVYLNHFISDPPTTTLQRIKGITTGSLPTFIDISTNFGSSELIEDNIVNQWNRFGFDLKFAGDDTWTSLFPQRFNETLPYPSFNVKDLDTVDRGVEKFILDSLSNETKGTNQKPEILLGHMLGIDHCGHTFGKNHQQMKRKLIELNDFLKKIVALMDKETLVILFGDHGMTSSGDHGGESEEEVDAALFVISGKPLNLHRQSVSERSYMANISQIDIVPTLAALTGVAIPYSNLGVIRPEMLTSLARADQYVEANVKQISQYVSSYERKFGSLNLPADVQHFLSHSNSTWNTTHSLSVLQTIQTHFRSKWAQFNVPLIYGGILGCCLHILSLFSQLVQQHRLPSTVDSIKYYSIFRLFMTFFQIFIKDSFIIPSLLLGLVAIELLGIVRNLLPIIKSGCSHLSIFPVIVACSYILVPFSNSFIVAEDSIVQYFLQSLLLVKAGQCLLKHLGTGVAHKLKRFDRNKAVTKSSFPLMKMSMTVVLTLCGSACLIFGMSYKICREEQRLWCLSKTSSVSPGTLVIFLLPVLLVAHRYWLTKCGNLDSGDFNVLNVKYVLPLASTCLFFHHCMQFAQDSKKYALIVDTASLIFPRMAVLLSLLSLLFLIISPLFMYHRQKFDDLKRLDVPFLFKYLREKRSEDSKSVTVHGLATIFSSAVFTALLAVCIFLSVLLKAQFVLGIVSVLAFLFIYSVLCAQLVDWNEVLPDDISASLPGWEMALVMTLLAQFGFFSTGHQATISNIPWYSVFIGWSGEHRTQIIPAIMLNVNIFSSHILVSLLGSLVPFMVLSISLGPANPFFSRNQKRRTDPDDSNIGDFYFFKDDNKASKFLASFLRYITIYLVLQSTVTLGTIVSAGHARRHLMAWKIFVPKMMYSVLGLFVVYGSSILGYLFIRRVQRIAVQWRCKHT